MGESCENIHSQNDKVEYDLSKPEHIITLCEIMDLDIIQETVKAHLEKLIQTYVPDYNVLFLFDEYTSISFWESNKIYESLKELAEKKDILLILNSAGGSIEPAYLISQTCKKSAMKKFVTAIPRRAKSAATLLSLGADEIHMGMISELGPIDPQIKLASDSDSWPALGLGHSLKYIAKLACKYPGSSKMFSKYLSSKIEPHILGYFERVSESAVQYAERLIGKKNLPKNKSARSVAETLVYHYKDHEFVIDFNEAQLLLGSDIIKENTKEYEFANKVYYLFDAITFHASTSHEMGFTYVGSPTNGLRFIDLSI